MKRAKDLPDIQKQLIKFTLIGIFAVMVDFIFYYMFMHTLPEKETLLLDKNDISKTLSFICGSIVTYNLNKYWTWKQKDRSNTRFTKFISLYLVSLLLNVGVNKGALLAFENVDFLQSIPFQFPIAFVLATGFSAVFNFAGQKVWVFKVKEA